MNYYRIKFNYDNFVKAENEHDALVKVLETLPESHFSNNITTCIDAKTEAGAWDIYEKTSSWIYSEVVDVLARILVDEMASDIKLTLEEEWECCQNRDVYRSFSKQNDVDYQYDCVQAWLNSKTGKKRWTCPDKPFTIHDDVDGNDYLVRNPNYKENK